ncbi:glycerate kinase [Tessaracoccus sp. OH4464_COT-324]|uniref:glycerate kinase n=1 Tax=Tessaracoccus sp. OH4464_COT-324 TaxID=2491059 RepID=UPI001319EB51|nr:glycerate kinase [Tessaracoccus sp. OH4464_COT-324]
MRVLITSGAIGSVSPGLVSATLASAFRQAGASVAVVDLAPSHPTPRDLGQLAEVLGRGEAIIDLRGCTFQPSAARAARRVLERSDWTAIVADGESELELTGLKGAAVRNSRTLGEGLAGGLAADAAAVNWLAENGLADGPGAGAVNGLGALLIAAGVRLAESLPYEIAASGFRRGAGEADLVVVGTNELDFHLRGGPLVARVVEVATEFLVPVIVVAERCFISARELRLAGIEAAYPVFHSSGGVADVADLAELARRVARSWRF